MLVRICQLHAAASERFYWSSGYLAPVPLSKQG